MLRAYGVPKLIKMWELEKNLKNIYYVCDKTRIMYLHVNKLKAYHVSVLPIQVMILCTSRKVLMHNGMHNYNHSKHDLTMWQTTLGASHLYRREGTICNGFGYCWMN